MPDVTVDISDAAVDKDGNVFSVTRPDGSLPLAGDHPYGIYCDDCRYLSGHAAEPAPARVERRLDGRGAVHERVTAAGPITLRLAADLAPMLVVRGWVEPGAPAAAEALPDGIRFGARGRDGVLRTATVTAVPAPVRVEIDAGALHFAADSVELRYELSPAPEPVAPVPPAAALAVDDPALQGVIDRALDDLRMLRSSVGGHTYLVAGVPWYATLFGRDSLITALQVLPLMPDLAEQTLRALADHLGQRRDPIREEDPGKVLHELRPGEVAAADLSPLARYYGTADATPLWLCVACAHADRTGDRSLLAELREQIDAMLAWIDGPGDRDGDGLVDYAASTPDALRNQGWKDSADAICDPDGRPLEPPIALVEVQAYVVRAKRELGRLLGDAALAREAGALQERLERFWLPRRACYAMALGDGGRPTAALASNQGHLLWARALTPARARATRDALMSDALFSGWGIRTLGADEPAYDPLSYHRGSVWPHDSALIAAGLRDHGFDADFARIAQGLLDAAAAAPDRRLPELFGGQPRGAQGEPPVPYPVACRPQAWAAGSVPYLLATGLLAGEAPWLPAGTDHARLGERSYERAADGTVRCTGR